MLLDSYFCGRKCFIMWATDISLSLMQSLSSIRCYTPVPPDYWFFIWLFTAMTILPVAKNNKKCQLVQNYPKY